MEAERGQLPSHNTSLVAAIHALEQQVSYLDEAHYDALREACDASRRAAELGMQVLEARVRLCAFTEHEPVGGRQTTSDGDQLAVLRLAHLYFDEPGKYRLVLEPYSGAADKAMEDRGQPMWCSRVVYDTSRPAGKTTLAIPEMVRAAYTAARQRGYVLTWE